LRRVDEIHTHGSKHFTWTFGGGEVVIVELDAAAISVAEQAIRLAVNAKGLANIANPLILLVGLP